MSDKPSEPLGMPYVKVWRRDFGEPFRGRYGAKADFKNMALLTYAFLSIVWDADEDEVRSYLPKSLHPLFDVQAKPKAEQVRRGYANTVDGKAKKVRKHGAGTVREQCENGATTVQAQCKHGASTDAHTPPPAETSNLGNTLIKAKANANAEAINQASSIEAESHDQRALRFSSAEAAEAQARGEEKKTSTTWKMHDRAEG